MADLLPSGDMGSKNLPVPVVPSLPEGLGDREVSASPKVKDGLEPIIMSLDLLNESIGDIASVVSSSDMDKLTVSELDKLFQRYFSKQAIADSVTLSLTRQSPPAIDSSLMVRQQLKANDIIQKQPQGKFEDVFSNKSSSKSSSGKSGGMSLEEGYNKTVGKAYDLTHNPMKFLDELIPSMLSLFKKKESSEKSEKKSKEGKSFYGQGEVEEGSFYGSFSNQATKAVGTTVENASDVSSKSLKGVTDVGTTGIVGAKALLGAALGVNLNANLEGDLNPGAVGATTGGKGEGNGSPLGTVTDPIYMTDTGSDSGVTSSVDDIQEESAEVGIKADKALTDTLENPDQSSFANFVSGGGGEGGGRGGKKGKSEGGAGIGTVLIAGMILAALIIFKDVVEKIFDKVIIPLGEVVIDFLNLIKQPLVDLISAIINIVVVVLGIIGDILVAIAPSLVLMAEAICGIVVTVLGIVGDILVAIAPIIVQIAEVLAGTVLAALKLIGGILETISPYLIAIVDTIGGILVTIVKTIGALIDIITFPIRIVSRILATLEPHIIRIADFIGGTIADWFEENEDTIKELMDKVTAIATSILDMVAAFNRGFGSHMEGIGDELGRGLQQGLEFLNNIFSPILLASQILEKAVNAIRESWFGKLIGIDAKSIEEDEAKRLEEKERSELARRRDRGDTGLEGLLATLFPESDKKSDNFYLEGIFKNTAVMANLMFESNKAEARLISRVRSINDLIITSSGDVFETSPYDSILAIQNGSVSMQASNPVSGVSPPSSSSESSQQSSNPSVTNVYNSSSSVDYNGVNPFSEFSPVGVF